MSTGSKVVLLLSFLFIGVLIWYYGPASDATTPVAEDPILALAPVEARPAPAPPVERRLASPTAPTATTVTPPALPAPPATASNIQTTWATTARPRGTTTTSPGTLVMGQPRTTTTALPPRRPIETATVPASRVTTVVATPEPPMRTYVIAEGDTLSGISVTYYGTETAWLRIAEANPDVDPDRLRIGTSLRIPAHTPRSPRASRVATATRPASTTPVDGRNHHVENGESLSSIADHYYGRETQWTRIFEANRALLQNDPNRLRIGMVLSIPGQ